MHECNVFRPSTATAVLLLVMCMTNAARMVYAAPASVRVSFSSPPHSYQHGHDLVSPEYGSSESSSTGSVVTTRAIAAPYPPAARLRPTAEPTASTILHQYTQTYPGVPQRRDFDLLQQEVHQEYPVEEELTEAELQSLVARFASNEPRFFSEFPHQRALLANIELRRSQNLPELRIGSIRPGSPFLRA